MSHWLYKNQLMTELPDGVFGFVYRITMIDPETEVFRYIGRKYVHKTVRKAIKKKDGTKSLKKKKVVSESDWRSYTGSCDPLNKAIDHYGKDRFQFEILAFGYTKGQVNFMEESVQHRCNVLCDATYYNDSIGSRRFIGVKFDDQFINELRSIEL